MTRSEITHEADEKSLITTSHVQDGNSPLHLACANGFKDVAKVLCDTPKCEVDGIDNNGRTALHWAAATGYPAVIRVLLAANVSGV